MRRVFTEVFGVGLMIMVSLSQPLFAQDVGSLSPAEMNALLEKYRSLPASEQAALREQYGGSLRSAEDSTVYSTPPVLTDEPLTRRPESSRSTPTRQAGGPARSGELQPFGIELFAGPRETLPPNDIASDDSYILGPGDEILIYLWGRADKEFHLTVDREGKIFIPKVGDLIVWGKTLGDFKQEARKRLARIYSETDLTISLGKIRSIRIFLTGEVTFPGAYTVSSLTSLYNALFLAGGPNPNGSMRTVQLKRGGKTVQTLDLYDFLLRGDNSFDIRLESGDVVFVPVAGGRVTIRGEVIRPAIYELKGGEKASDLIELAGGATARAHLEHVMLERIARDDEWRVFDLDLTPDAAGGDTTDMLLRDGDRITVSPVFQARKNRVAIFGKVKYPGYYERSDTTTLAGLVAQSQLQDYDVHFERASLFRRFSDWRTEIIPFDLGAVLRGEGEETLLQDRDSVYIYSLQEVGWDRTVHIQGEVKKPGPYEYYADMTVQDLVFLAGSYTKGAYTLWAELARTDSLGTVTLERLDLADPADLSTPLAEDDRVYIRQIPEWQLHPTVSISGEVNFPGEYVLTRRNETLRDLIKRAGGFTPEAFPVGTIMLRPSIAESLNRLGLRQQLEKSTPLVMDSLGQIQRRNFVEFDAGAARRIALDLDLKPDSTIRGGDLVLEHGDLVFVPTIPSGISVLGAVGINSTIQYLEGKKVSYYIDRAGGFTRRADESETRLIKANGTAYAGRGTGSQWVDRGDIIAVPTKIEREGNFTRQLVTILTVATASITAIILVSKI